MFIFLLLYLEFSPFLYVKDLNLEFQVAVTFNKS